MSGSKRFVSSNGGRVAFVSGCRTPFARAGGMLADLTALDLARGVVRELIERTELDEKLVERAIMGIVVPDIKATNLARESVLAAGLPPSIEACTVSRACASANQAIVGLAESIALGQIEVGIAGGAESLSNVPIMLSKPMATALIAAQKAKTLSKRIQAFSSVRLKHLIPVRPAIAELSTGLTMGQSAEKMAKENRISREEQDQFALASHQRAAAATKDGRLTAEIVRTYVPPDFVSSLGEDDGIRAETSIGKLSRLRPVFDKHCGTVTAGNSSPLTDGAAAMILMPEDKAKALGYEPLGYIRSYSFVGVDPFEQLLIGPAYSTPIALERAGLELADMDLIDLHEAFAAQVLSILQAFESETFAREKLGRSKAIGKVDPDKVNVQGGSIAIGHPFGATGARITLSLLNELRRRGGRFGLLGLCAAGALGFSMVVEIE